MSPPRVSKRRFSGARSSSCPEPAARRLGRKRSFAAVPALARRQRTPLPVLDLSLASIGLDRRSASVPRCGRLAVLRDAAGERRILVADETGALPDLFYGSAQFRDAVAAGANEIHVHLLTEDVRERAALLRDLDGRALSIGSPRHVDFGSESSGAEVLMTVVPLVRVQPGPTAATDRPSDRRVEEAGHARPPVPLACRSPCRRS